MKIILKGPQKDNVAGIIRKIGYYAQKTEYGKISAIKPFEAGGFPRFHIYIETSGIDIILNLHLDQKQASYKGSTAHSGEYGDKAVEWEAQRIQNLLK